ncbi:MAG TPA: PBP1A family penicillin-binding protein [Candidatus Saccharimonadales bacterium]|nr:PBP1A family penicillin-binding protein [Candidatus Saccharimonadales bacterium]
MAKRRKKKRSFYKTRKPAVVLASPEIMLHIPAVVPTGWALIKYDAPAVIHDIAEQIRRIQRALWSVPAKAVYYLGAITVGFGTLGFGAVTAYDTLQHYGPTLNNPAVIMNTKNTGTTILDRNGEVLYQGYGAVLRHNIPYEEMPTSLKQATLAAEDPDFYKHQGFSWKGTARAVYQDAIHTGKIQGGSTITQQLVKNTLLSSEKSFTRKYKEIILSIQLEHNYSKDQIMQMYLNTIYFGQGAYGVESAAETYFHKSPKNLTLEESALLAGLPQSPSVYDPNINPDGALERRNYVLQRMQELGYISPQTAKIAVTSAVQAGIRDYTIKAPHFVFYVLDQLRSQYGSEMVEKGGIVVHTSLDYAKQQKAEEIVKTQVTKLAGHHATNGGLVSIDTHNGDILAMVGSANYDNPNFGAVNVTLAQLQPGSSFKPIAYVTAFAKGWNGATKVDDKPIKLPQGDGTIYAPQNYDQKFRGPVTLRRALANSLNIPAVEVLQYAGIHDTINTAHALGIQAPSLTDESRYGMSLVLGGGEVRPIDMAGVYATFANKGVSVQPRAITRVEDRFGNNITQPRHQKANQAVDGRLAYMITNILSDNGARTEEFGANSPLKLSRPAAAKTGTTNDFRDNWTVGYTPDIATAVWVGNNDHTPMQNVDGITGAAPIWHDYMEMALAGTPVNNFAIPSGLVTAKVCATDGGLVDDNDTKGVTEVFLAEAKPTQHCGWSSPKPKPVLVQAETPAAAPAQVASAPEEGGRGGGDPSQDQNPPTPNPGNVPTPRKP